MAEAESVADAGVIQHAQEMNLGVRRYLVHDAGHEQAVVGNGKVCLCCVLRMDIVVPPGQTTFPVLADAGWPVEVTRVQRRRRVRGRVDGDRAQQIGQSGVAVIVERSGVRGSVQDGHDDLRLRVGGFAQSFLEFLVEAKWPAASTRLWHRHAGRTAARHLRSGQKPVRAGADERPAPLPAWRDQRLTSSYRPIEQVDQLTDGGQVFEAPLEGVCTEVHPLAADGVVEMPHVVASGL